MVYVKGVGLPSTVEICGIVLNDGENINQAGDRWLEANKDAIERGHAFAAANPPKNGKTLDEYNTALVEDFRVKFGEQPESFKTSWCEKYAASLDKKTN